MYRSNLTKTSDFFAIFEVLLDTLNDSDKDCVVVGDFNIDFIGPLNSDLKKMFDIINTRNFCNIVDFPTRVTDASSTCLDHVYVKNECARAGTVLATPVRTAISDHYAVRASMLCQSPANGSASQRSVARLYSQNNTYNFVAAMESVDWELIAQKYTGSSTNELANALINIIQNKLDA